MTLKLATSITEQLATGGPSAALAMAGVENRGYNRKPITQVQNYLYPFL